MLYHHYPIHVDIYHSQLISVSWLFGLENMDFLNYNLVFSEKERKDEKIDLNDETEIFLNSQKKKVDEYEKFDLKEKPEIKSKLLRLFKKYAPSNILFLSLNKYIIKEKKKTIRDEKVNKFSVTLQKN